MKKFVYLIITSVLAGNLFAAELHVKKTEKNLVKFVSDAPIEKFEGVTDKIDGYLFWEGDDFTQKSEFYFEVDLNTLDTGIGLRNRHMRENYLHTEKYPFTHYKGKIVSFQKLTENRYSLQSEGKIYIHGVEKDLKTEVVIILAETGEYLASAKFEVKLSDFDIEIPSIMFYKIDETMELSVSFSMEPAGEQE